MSEEEQGREVLSLFPGTEFLCQSKSPIRNKVWIEAWVPTRLLYDGLRLTEKTKLYNQERKAIGKVSYSFNPMQLLEVSDSLTHIIISGYMPKGCTDLRHVPEIELSNLLDKAENNERIKFFEAFLQKYSFVKTIENNDYTSYLIKEPEFVQQILVPRILMVFYKTELIAIFHTQEVRVKKYDSIEMGSQYKMIYNSKFSEHTKQEMVAIYKSKLQSFQEN
ncbi:MAG: hypothetical protein MH472_01660 [Bacteroidia bacterium]|nr:hypothetical protein [Bacteroidia bacterium]